MGDFTLSRLAFASIQEQCAYIGARNPGAANAVKSELHRACDLISDFPEMGRKIESTGLRYHITRKYRYRVACRITAEGVEIADILHPKQR